MAAPLAQQAVNVERDGEALAANVAAVVRAGVLTITDQRGNVLERIDDVTTVEPQRGGRFAQWIVNTASGTVFTITKARQGCGCGGGR